MSGLCSICTDLQRHLLVSVSVQPVVIGWTRCVDISECIYIGTWCQCLGQFVIVNVVLVHTRLHIIVQMRPAVLCVLKNDFLSIQIVPLVISSLFRCSY